MRKFVVVVMLALGCVQPGAVTCPDGRTCPDNTVCHPTIALCVLESDKPPCNDLVDGDKCGEGTAEPGICEAGYCISGCGDGVADDGEECDDGNFRSHDGCSSACVLEQRSWTEWHPDWGGRSRHALAYHAARKELVMFGGGTDITAFKEYWVRDASGQWTRFPSPLELRNQVMMAYDAERQKIVLFGGSSATDLGDTWEYDGAWTKVTPSTSPPGRRAGSMTYDGAKKRIVLFGGRFGPSPGTHLADLWEYDGVTWTNITPTVGPMPGGRGGAAFAWDALRNVYVLFCGEAIGTPNDLWEFSNGAWSSIPLVGAPNRRYGASFAWSPLRQKLVLYGGYTNNTYPAADTWEYNGTWTGIVSPLVPPARTLGSFAFDTERNALVVVGGINSAGGVHDDVWEYGDGVWVNASPRLFPSARAVRATYDTTREEVVMFGGFGRGSTVLGDTWTFDGTAWREENPPPQPALPAPQLLPRYSHQLTYDAERQRVVMFSGARSQPSIIDTWEWDGSAWTNAPEGPSARAYAAMADIPGNGIVMFGGLLLPGGASSYRDTWEFDGATWTEVATPEGLLDQNGAVSAFDVANQRTILFATDGTTWSYANRTWTQIATTGPSKRAYAAMVYDPWLQRVVLYGGDDGGATYSDLWELVGDTWVAKPLLGLQPAARERAGLAALPRQRSLLLFGGLGQEDTWFLKYVSETPEENCGNGEDDDGDRQIDDADPDCS